MSSNLVLQFLIFGLISSLIESANILFYSGLTSYSHRIAVWPLVSALAETGSHNITFLTVYPPKAEHLHPNVTELSLRPSSEQMRKFDEFENVVNVRLRFGRFGSVVSVAAGLPDISIKVCSDFLSAPPTQQWIQSSHFDLVVIDSLFNECGFGLAHKFGAKTLIFGTTSVFSWWYDVFGFPGETSWISDMLVPFQIPMNFIERVASTLMPLAQYWFKYWLYYPKLDEVLREKLNSSGMPSVLELEKQTSLILLSTHFSEEFSRSLPPLIVPVGGIHMGKSLGNAIGQPNMIGNNNAISPELQKWMDDSGPDGFIYVSFGSIVKISQAPQYLQHIFYTSFNSSRVRFVWKFEEDRPSGMPRNVFTGKWMSQQAILAHPKIRAFITHAGSMSLTEALANGVPVIMFPIFAEQDYNAFRYEREGRGIRLEMSTLTLAKMEAALNEILTNPKYKEVMLQTKTLFYDRPMTPLQTAVWWTEYVLRHDNLTCLKPFPMSQTWYERRLLDVWAFIGGIGVCILLAICYLVKILLLSLLFFSTKQISNVKLKVS